MIRTAAFLPTPDELCTGVPPAIIAAPAQFVEPLNEYRLSPQLRAAAVTGNSLEILTRSAVAHYEAMHGKGDPLLGDALADLAVTGRKAYFDFKANPLPDAKLKQMTAARLQTQTPPIAANPADIETVVRRALNRAYTVAWAIRGPANRRAAIRALFNWIAVSGEDDTPHRPVNVPSPKFEQHDIKVTVGAVTVRTRYLIASEANGPAPLPPQPVLLLLPNDQAPQIPADHKVILFLHGHSSSADEAIPLIPEIIKAGLAQGTGISVISLDLPNSGYSETFGHTQAAPSSATTYPGGITDGQKINAPIVQFVEDFVIAFVNALDAVLPVKNRFAGVIGGSLGGNLGLRLGRANTTANPWISAGIVSWSPASVWNPLIRNEILRKGPDHCRDNWHLAETPLSRHAYFDEVFDQPINEVLMQTTQPGLWYRNDWTPCKDLHITEARIARREIYSANFRQWHWRLAGEQLIHSHIDRVDHFDNSTPFRWQMNTVRMLLMAGAADDHQGTHIYQRTQDLAHVMAHVPGESLFLLSTGHSMHIERPAFVAGRIVGFLLPPARRGWSSLGGQFTSGPAVASWAPNRLDLFARGMDNALWTNSWTGKAWTGWHQLAPNPIASDPAAVSWGPNRIDLFARGTDNQMYTMSWTGTQWTAWVSLGGQFTSGPTVASWAPNRLDLFGRGMDNAVWTNSWTGAAWTGWRQLAPNAITSDPAAVSWGPNRIDLFARGTDNQMYTMSWNGAQWTGWVSLRGQFTSGPAVASWAPNRLDLFARGMDNALWTNSWTGSAWTGWHQLAPNPIASDPSAVSWGSNRIDVFARGTDNQMYTMSWDGTRW